MAIINQLINHFRNKENHEQYFGIVIFVIIALGIFFRTYGLLSSSIWYDESFSLAIVQEPLFDVVRLAAKDFSPPLWEIILWPIIRLLGVNTLGLRILAWLAGIASIFLLYRLGKIHIKDPFNLISTLTLTAMLPGLFWIAQDGRVYAVYSLLYLCGFYYATNQRWLGLFAVCGLILYSHATGLFFVSGLLATAFIFNPKKWRQIILVGVCACTSWLPWLPITVNAVEDYIFLPFSFSDFIYQFVGAFFGPTLSGNWLIASMVIFTATLFILLFTWLIRGLIFHDWKSIEQLAFVAVWVPLIGMVLVSTLIKPIVFYRPLAPLIIPLCILIGGGIRERSFKFITIFTITCWIVLLGFSLTHWSPEIRGGYIDKAAEIINENHTPGEIVFHATGTSWLPFKYYLDPQIPQQILDLPQPSALLRREIGISLGAEYGKLANNQAAWIVYAVDPVLSIEGQKYMSEIIKNAQLVTTIRGWQFAPIEIWYRPVGSTDE